MSNKIAICGPFPVLAKDRNNYLKDYSFDFYINENEFYYEKHDLILPSNYILNSNSLNNLIANKDAIVEVTAHGMLANYGQVFRFDSNRTDMDILIKVEDNRYNTDFEARVIATHHLKDPFIKEELNGLFKQRSYIVEPGSILASAKYSINIDLGDEQRALESIFNLQRISTQQKNTIYDYQNNKIIIKLNDILYQYYCRLCVGNFNVNMINDIIKPALQTVLAEMVVDQENETESFNDYTWYHVINKRLEQNSLSLDTLALNDCEDVANILLGDSLNESIINLIKILESEEVE